MHLPDGLVSGNLSLIGYLGSGILSILSSRKISAHKLAQMGMITSVLFVASLLHVPVMGTSVHFSLVGLAGILLGPASFVSVLIATLFQFIFFRHGGWSTWGLNSLHLGLGALSAWLVWQAPVLRTKFADATAFVAGWTSAVVKVTAFCVTLILAGFPRSAIITVFATHIPVIVVEGLIIGLLVRVLGHAKDVGVEVEFNEDAR